MATTFLGQKFLKYPGPPHPPIKNVPSLTENGKRMNNRKLLPCRHMQLPTHRVPLRCGPKGKTTSNINLDSRALLRMTATERRALGNPDTNYVCDWFTTGTMKTLVIGQFKYARKIELTVRESVRSVVESTIGVAGGGRK